MSRNAIESELRPSVKCFQKKVSYWSEMTRNAIESDFWTSKMAIGGHLKKKHLQKKLSEWFEQ